MADSGTAAVGGHDAGVDELTHVQRVKAIFAGSLGNLIIWLDFYIYAYLALYFAPAFFPDSDSTVQLLNVAGIYAAGFLIRPLGSWFFGRYADRSGRRTAIILAVMMMGAGSLMIAALPTYAVIGAWAPALLLVARLMQGFSIGGQFGAAASYLSEMAVARRRGFYASFQLVTLIGGQLGALLLLVMLQQSLSEQAIRDWGWRVPFVFGAVLPCTILFLKGMMHETASASRSHAEAGSMRGLFRHPKSLLIVVSITAGGALCFYAFTTYMQKYLVNTAGMDVRTVTLVMTAAMIFYMMLLPAVGALSDRIGRRCCLLIFSGLMTLLAVPILQALETVSHPVTAFLLMACALGILSFYSSISGLFKAELFPAHVRALGVGLAHTVAAAIFGGTAEWVGLLFRQAGFESGFYWYISACCAAAFVTALVMREPSRTDLRA